MPVTRSRNGFYDIGSLDQTNTTRFLFGDEDNSGENKSYSHVNSSDDGFPTLLRTSEYPNMVSLISSVAIPLLHFDLSIFGGIFQRGDLYAGDACLWFFVLFLSP